MRCICLILFLCVRVESQVTEPWTQPVDALIASGDLAQARQRLERENASRGETPAGLYLEARILFEEHRYREALQQAQRSLTMAPKAPELYKLAALSAIRLDRLDIAEPALKTATQLAPDDYLAHFHLGALYYTKSLFLAARPELEKAVRLNPGYMPALLFLGLTQEEVGDEKSTVATYRKAIEVADAQRSAREMPYIYLGRFYYRRDRFDDGLPLLEKASEINPGSAEAWLELGKTLHGLKRDSEALAALQRSSAAEAGNPEPHYLLFRIFESQDQEQAAQRELQRFQELSKQRPPTDAARRKLPDTP
jgi:tetratricopeptide (TPR) repeat protein